MWENPTPILSKLECKGNVFNLVKIAYKKPKGNVALKGKKPNTFPTNHV
jgi:hypothetical protein